MSMTISVKQKRLWTPALVKYYGNVCFYCETPFVVEQHKCDGYDNPYHVNYDHLNNKEADNRPENIVLAHSICNQRKKQSSVWTKKAIDQLKTNESDGALTSLCERLNKRNALKDDVDDDNAIRDTNEELFSNPEFIKITSEYIEEKLSVADRIPHMATCNSIAMKCFNELGHGSPNTIWRAVGMLASEEGHLRKYREGGKMWISKKDPLYEA